jgi:hypothetical protein
MCDHVSGWESCRDAVLSSIRSAYAGAFISIESLSLSNEASDEVFADLIEARDRTSLLYWRDIPDSWIEDNFDAIPLFKPDEMPVFLPAYMRYALNMMQERTNVIEFLVHSLYSVQEKNKRERQFSLLTFEQKRSVLYVLLAIKLYRTSQPSIAAEAEQAIVNYWAKAK